MCFESLSQGVPGCFGQTVQGSALEPRAGRCTSSGCARRPSCVREKQRGNREATRGILQGDKILANCYGLGSTSPMMKVPRGHSSFRLDFRHPALE